MERLDSKIEMVAFGQINKLDIRGGQLAARENLIFLLNNLPESSLVKDFITRKIEIEFELLASCSDGKLTIKDSVNIQNLPIWAGWMLQLLIFQNLKLEHIDFFKHPMGICT